MKQTLRFGLYIGVVAVAFAVAALVQNSAAGKFIELRAYDLRFFLQGSVPRERPAPITILGIDEEALREIPVPFIAWNGLIAKVIEGLVDSGAKTVGVDILFSDTSGFNPEGQRALAAALIGAGGKGMPVVLAYQVRSTGAEDLPLQIHAAASSFGNQEGFVNLTSDSDDFIRRQSLRDEKLADPSFALAIAQAFTEKQGIELNKAQEEVFIDYRDRETLPVVSFAKALEAVEKHNAEFMRRQFADRIVLIARYGLAADEDLHATPFYYWSGNPTGTGRRTPGIVIHANTIGTLINGKFIAPLRPLQQYLLALAMAVIVTLACAFFPPALAFAASGLLVSGFLYYALVVSFQHRIWMWIMGPVAACLCSVALAQTANYVVEGRDKKRIRSLFKGCMHEDVIEELLRKPAELILSGERRKIAVMFADVKSFTTRSEFADPAQIVVMQNVYFKEIVEAIKSNRGYVNSLMGDGLMAIFGAPRRDEDAALHAVHAAFAMLEALKRVNETLVQKGLDPIDIGIGINYGEAIVGTMGSPDKYDYTANGDTVNTAARIEGLTRRADVGSSIVITEAAQQQLNGRIPTEYVDEFELKGKKTKVRIHRVMK